MDFKQFLTEKGISDEAFEQKTPAELAQLHTEYVDTRLTDADKQSAIDALKQEIKDLENKVKENGLEMNKIIENGGAEKVQGLAEVLKQHQPKIDEVMKSDDRKVMSFTIKANTLASTAITDSTIGMRDPSLSPLAHRTLTMYDLFRKVQVGPDQGGIVKYIDWDEQTTARAAAFIGEGLAFPESTAAWTEYNISLKKIGDTIPLSEEMAFDHARFAGELENFLRVNVELEIDDQLLLGTGLTVYAAGLDSYAPAFTAVASNITDASFYDLVPTVAADIAFAKGNKFRANVCLMNMKEINKFKLKKDGSNNYIIPPFTNGYMNIDGVMVVQNDNVPDDVCYIGDTRYGTIYEASEGYSITVGEIDDQFTKDLKTLKARKRLNLLIKNSELAAWRKVESIAADLVTLATDPNA